MRDLKADLGIARGMKPLNTSEYYEGISLETAQQYMMAVEGWPRAIERALKVETLAQKLVEVLEGVQRLKPLIAYPDEVLPEFEEEAITIVHMLNTIDSVVTKAKGVLGDE